MERTRRRRAERCARSRRVTTGATRVGGVAPSGSLLPFSAYRILWIKLITSRLKLILVIYYINFLGVSLCQSIEI